jgi:hypothetical protein
MKTWTHKYRYKMELPYPIDRAGKILTGTLTTDREFTPAEVEKLAKEMAHGRADAAKLVECELIEARS